MKDYNNDVIPIFHEFNQGVFIVFH